MYLQSGKVSFQNYDDFEGFENPNLVERVKVDLSRLRVDYFDYVHEYKPQPLDEPKEFFFQQFD